MRAKEFIIEADDPNDPTGQIAIHKQGLEMAVASQYTGDGQFKFTINNQPYIVTVGGFELDDLNPGLIDSFYLTNAKTGKTEHITGSWDYPLAVAIYNNLRTNQKPALRDIYKQDMAFHDKHGWNTGHRPDRLQGLAQDGYITIPADRFVKAHKDMKKATGQDIDNVGEAQQWQGNRGADQAQSTDHTMDEARQYIKGNYPFAKKYRVRRAEPGFRANQDPSQYNRSNAHVTDVDSAMDYLQLKQNPVMSGSKQISHSLGYSWHTNENPGSGIAVLYYEDRGMGWDEIVVAAKDKKNLAGAVQVFRDAGVIK